MTTCISKHLRIRYTLVHIETIYVVMNSEVVNLLFNPLVSRPLYKMRLMVRFIQNKQDSAFCIFSFNL